jgi:hypothetical protein
MCPDRRRFLKISSALLAASILGGIAAGAKGAGKPPNIVMILADDLGWADVGHDLSKIETPNLDRIADLLAHAGGASYGALSS